MLKKLNLSGHRNDKLTELGFTFPGTLQVNLADEQLPEKIVAFLTPYINSGDIVHVVLPGLAPLATLVLTAIHGLSGTFPTITTMIRTETGFEPSVGIDLQTMRNQIGRVARKEVVIL